MRSLDIKPNSEEALAIRVSDYLKSNYPDIIFHFDYGSGLKMTIGQAKRQKRLNKRRGWPDLFIAKPARKFNGLFIELKKDGIKLRKKNGEWIDEHISEQAKILEELNKDRYKAEFAIGFTMAKKIIDDYLSELRTNGKDTDVLNKIRRKNEVSPF